ncbi:MAG: alanine--tRNA ligase-related protein [Thermoplasmata archaeon]
MKDYYFRIDPYARELETEILEISETQVILRDTIFYPGGGGQPPDTGKISGSGFEADITSARKQGDLIVHSLSNIHGKLEKGTVKITLNWDRRYSLMKSHTGEHLFYRALELLYPIHFEKVEFQPEESVLFVSGNLSFDQVKEAEDLANRKIRDALNVHIHIQNPGQVSSDIRLKRDRIKDDSVRVVEIEDYDKSACTGIHVKNTKEIEILVATRLKRSKYLELYFRVGDFAREYLRRAVTELYDIEMLFNQAGPELVKKIENTKNELDILKKEYYDLTSKMFRFDNTRFHNLNFYWSRSELGDFKGIEKRAQEIVNSETAIVLYGSQDEEKIFLLFSKSLSIDLQQLYRLIEKYNQKGGGKGNFLMINAQKEVFNDLFDTMKKFIIENFDK